MDERKKEEDKEVLIVRKHLDKIKKTEPPAPHEDKPTILYFKQTSTLDRMKKGWQKFVSKFNTPNTRPRTSISPVAEANVTNHKTCVKCGRTFLEVHTFCPYCFTYNKLGDKDDKKDKIEHIPKNVKVWVTGPKGRRMVERPYRKTGLPKEVDVASEELETFGKAIQKLVVKKKRKPRIIIKRNEKTYPKYRCKIFMTGGAERQLIKIAEFMYHKFPETEGIEHRYTLLGYQLNLGWESEDHVEYRIITSIGTGPVETASLGYVASDENTLEEIQTLAKETQRVPLGEAHTHPWPGGHGFFSGTDFKKTLQKYAHKKWDPGHVSIVVDPFTKKWAAYMSNDDNTKAVRVEIPVLTNNPILLPIRGRTPNVKIAQPEMKVKVKEERLVKRKPIIVLNPTQQEHATVKTNPERITNRMPSNKHRRNNRFSIISTIALAVPSLATGLILFLGKFGLPLRTLGIALVELTIIGAGLYWVNQYLDRRALKYMQER